MESTMADTSTNNAGGLVKKILFPASSSGANDSFRNPIVGAKAAPGSPRASPSKMFLTAQDLQKPTGHAIGTKGERNNKGPAPPRFFSSTHPSLDTNTQNQQPPLQTPSRIPNSPPELQRKPVTPSSEMTAKASEQTPTIPINFSLNKSGEDDHAGAAGILNNLQKEQDDDALDFLKDFKSTPPPSRELEEAETEVHDNTTAQRIRKQQETLLSLDINSDLKDGRMSECPSDSQSSSSESKPTAMETPLNDQVDNDEADEAEEDAIPGIQGYSSYYDNPYVNPYASAIMKPNDLFRNNHKDQDTTVDSDINSNCSEMGTVIGAPMSNRFAEVDAMEREGKLAMQHDDDDNDEDVFGADNSHDILDEEEDPALANYKAFRINDDEPVKDDNQNDSTLFLDPFQTPSAAPTSVSRLNPPSSEILSTASQMGTMVGVSEARERLADIEAMADSIARDPSYDNHGDQSTHSEERTPRTNSAEQDESSRPDDQTGIKPESLPIRERDLDEPAISVVDSEIDQLIRQSASESCGDGVIKSFNSNNSAEVFRAPSGGSLADKFHQQRSNQQQSAQNGHDGKEDDELDIINGSRDSSIFSSKCTKKRPSSSLKRALTRAQQQIQGDETFHRHNHLGHDQKKEDEKEEKEEDLQQQQEEQQRYRYEVQKEEDCTELRDNETGVDSSHLASVGSPGRGLATTLQRIGTKLKRPSPSASSSNQNQQYFFDIDDDDEETDAHGAGQSTPDLTSLSQPSDIDPHGSNHIRPDHASLSNIQEVSPQSPSKGSSTESSPLDDVSEASLLKSPGESTRLMADFRRESNSSSASAGTGRGQSQRSTGWSGRVPNILTSASSASLGNGPLPFATGGRSHREHGEPQPQPFRFARGCLSFDTTADQHYEYDLKQHGTYNDNHRIKSTQSYDSRSHLHATPARPTSSAFRRFKGVGGKDSSTTTQALYRNSRSWDISSGMASSLWSAAAGTGTADTLKEQEVKPDPAPLTLDANAFRVAPYIRQQQEQQHPHPHGYNNTKGSRLISGEREERLRLMSDTPRAANNRQRMETLELLQTPQRIEIEREDALNLLACLCERGVALNPVDETDTKGDETDTKGVASPKLAPESDQDPEQPRSTTSDAADRSERHDFGNASTGLLSGRTSAGELEPETINEAVDTLRELSREKHRSGTNNGPGSRDHTVRMEVLDELMRSHTYALEMKRAALSASAWLRSIGHTENRPKDNARNNHVSAETGQAAGEGYTQSPGGTSATADNIQLLAVKALLHQAQIEAQEKEKAAQQLNEELSECRAEIGRLKSASRTKTSFTSPNRSILDDDSASENGANADLEAKKKSEGIMIVDESMVDPDSSLFAIEDDSEVVREWDQPLARELKMFKSALNDANAIIKNLHGELQEANPGNEARARKAPLIDVSPKAFSVALVDESCSRLEKSSNSFSDQCADNRKVNVRMLNGENFVTDWDQLESLPPPPDHGLRSPIVTALLQQWSADEALHASLLAWMDNLLSGADPSSVPPLTLSSLDHQVRDGFTMHVLPLLLRRSDLLVDVKTRADRKTTYDVAVSVKSNTRLAGSVRNVRHMDAHPDSASGVGSVTQSAVTEPVRNGDAGINDVYEVGSTVASYATHGSGSYSTLLSHRALDESPQPQAGLMSALGGAFGFLARRKPNASFYDAGIAGTSSYDMGSAAGAAGPGPMDFPSKEVFTETTRDQEPYHRLVSAPPGRIGVSFVEYRGHAMVSDVSNDSPLHGWIFPSDILIAIDEVPVSGMRLKDIVKVLQARSGRQRAMRVISSHAMNEFTMNAKTPT